MRGDGQQLEKSVRTTNWITPALDNRGRPRIKARSLFDTALRVEREVCNGCMVTVWRMKKDKNGSLNEMV